MDKKAFGLVVAHPEQAPLVQMASYAASDWVEALVFPEGYVRVGDAERVRSIARDSGKWIITGVQGTEGEEGSFGMVADPRGALAGRRIKHASWSREIEQREEDVVRTEAGVVGILLGYEIFIPEIARALAASGANVLVNPIGTGMWHEHQFVSWNAVARTRAIENRCFVLGCSTFNDTIPVAFAYAPGGECLVCSRDASRMVPVILDFERYQVRNSEYA